MKKLNLLFIFALTTLNLNALQDWYQHKTFVISVEKTNPEFQLNAQVEEQAKFIHQDLNTSIFFNTKNIVNTPLMKKEFEKIGGREFIIETQDHKKLRCSYFNRGSDKIIIVFTGLRNAKEKMAPFVQIFENYDVLLINFRGNGEIIRENINLNPLNCIIEKMLECDLSQVRFGKEEEKDVFAAVNFAKQQKNYQNITGLGICYGALILAKAQGMFDKINTSNETLFNNIILDGCWLSLEAFKEKVISNPAIVADPQRGISSPFAKNLFEKKWFISGLERFLKMLSHTTMDGLNVTDYLSEIKTSNILMFYGKNDLTITRDEFEVMWNSITQAPKIGIITSNEHVWNHLKQKELYKLICELFIESNSIDKVTMHLMSS